jgi:uncharacterized protein YndB with AHSA1/START domain
MELNDTMAKSPRELELGITWIFNAPRSLVWKAWCEPERMAQWVGPRGFTLTSCALGARPGDPFALDLRDPDGGMHRVRGVYREIVEGERLSYTWAWIDEAGTPGHETVVTVSFADLEGRTKLTLFQATFESASARAEHHGGWSSAFECLDEYLAAI